MNDASTRPTTQMHPKQLWPIPIGSKLIGHAVYAVLAIGIFLGPASGLKAQDNTTNSTQYWQGVLDVGSAKLTLNVEIHEPKGEEGYSASVYSVEQGNAEIPVDQIKVTKEQITLELNAIGASYEGRLDAAGHLCSGTFSQNGKEFDLELKRVKSFDETEDKLTEFWKGTFEPEEGIELEMGLKIFLAADGSMIAKLDSYSQGITDLPVEIEKDGLRYTVTYTAASLSYSGTLNESKDELLGTIRQGGSEHKLDFVKSEFSESPKFNRPQTPQGPFPYDAEEVKFENKEQGASLAGTLTIPAGDSPFPVAIMISGSGASDRDQSFFGHKPFLVIADHLARRGVAVLRFDDRGRGESTGKYSGATSADFAKDVEAGIEFLKQHPKIDAGRIGLIGHSEGGLIAPMIAAERDDVHFIVLLAGTGVDGGTILKSQSTAIMKADGQPAEKLEANEQIHDAILSIVKNRPDISDDELDAASEAFLDSVDTKTRDLMQTSAKDLVAILKSKWVRFFVRHDPVKTLAEVKCHVLAMNGEKDLQVLCDLNLAPIEKALQQGSPASFKVVRFPNMNHVFQETEGSGTPEDYGEIEESFSPKALKVISDWVGEVSKESKTKTPSNN